MLGFDDNGLSPIRYAIHPEEETLMAQRSGAIVDDWMSWLPDIYGFILSFSQLRCDNWPVYVYWGNTTSLEAFD
jgi:hypothetical protein